ncbi:LysR substrate-binding domain-containing protein [uncultured Roseibium sp.]|uniref:LysR substrate-binding domain-containing protein n=1 Tax=uncultured Roseibium sp. TaxID=1936171 RepID=UPI002595453F|nr:LysR substrate-binding domain-containing protein [uncultured Roseibium sp.]
MSGIPHLRLLVTFDTVCQLGSMQRAAQELNVTPPAVTQAIRALELEIGVPLLNRSTKPALPTEAGERLSSAIRHSFALIEDTIVDIRHLAGLSEQQLSLCCTLGMATYWLMPKLSGFYGRFPDITVNVQAPPSDQPVLSPGLDIALRYGRGGWTDGETWKLFDERACPVGTPQMIGQVAEAGGLEDVPLIEVRLGSPHLWDTWTDYFEQRGIKRARRPSHVFDNYVQAVQAALDGRGIMLGWRSITHKLVGDGSLVELPSGSHDFGTSYFVICSHRSMSKQSTKHFIDWVTGLDR